MRNYSPEKIRRLIGCWAAMLLVIPGFGQAEERLLAARRLTDTLCARTLAGRGYQEEGHLKAARLLAVELAAAGVSPLPGRDDYFQPFIFSPRLTDTVRLRIGKGAFEPGAAVLPALGSAPGSGRTRIADLGFGLPPYPRIRGRAVFFRETLPEHPAAGQAADIRPYLTARDRADSLLANGAGAVIIEKEKLTHGFAPQNLPGPVFEVLAPAPLPMRGKADYELSFSQPKITGLNLLGYVPGVERPDSFLVICAHYDHLGMVGKSWFPGGNDNASGVALLLALARHYADPARRLRHSVAFVLFGAEETGLNGSAHFVGRQPLIPLEKIRFLLNLDLMGNGEKGITVVAATEFPAEFELLTSVNDREQLFPAVNGRRNAPNSDHYYFVKAGVPAFFIYTLGGPPHYHNVPDNAENLLLSHFEESFQLVRGFFEELDKNFSNKP